MPSRCSASHQSIQVLIVWKRKTEIDSMLFNGVTNNSLLPKKYVSHLRVIFLYISKVTDKVLHEGLIVKLDRNDVCGSLLKLLRGLLRCREQWIVLNGNTHPGKMLKPII